MTNPEEIADSVMEQMQISHLVESRIVFNGDLHQTQLLEHVRNASPRPCITVCTGKDCNMLASLIEILDRRMSQMEDNQHPVRIRARRISAICLRRYSLSTFHFADGILARMFPNNRIYCEIVQCPNLTSTRSILRQFPHLVLLKIQKCTMLNTIHCLSDGCPNLELLIVQDCGLTFTPQEIKSIRQGGGCSWDAAFEALARNPGPLEILFSDCKALNAIPSSIKLLKNNLTTLSLCQLPGLTQLPPDIEHLSSLSFLRITNTGITRLPEEIGRLDSACAVFFQGENILCPPRCYRGSIDAMKSYFTRRRLKVFKGFVRLAVLFRQMRSRAIDRLFRPGGGGYKRCRDHFVAISQSSLDLGAKRMRISSDSECDDHSSEKEERAAGRVDDDEDDEE